jgi:S1-C subfamily serine protease
MKEITISYLQWRVLPVKKMNLHFNKMKKLLGILVLGLLLSGNAFADILLNKCVNVEKDNTISKLKENIRHEYYISFNEGKVYYTYVGDRSLTDFLNKKREEAGSKVKSRTTNKVYSITFVDDKILTAEFDETDEHGTSLKKEIEIDFETNRVSKFVYGLNNPGKKVSKMMKDLYERTDGRPFNLLQCINVNVGATGDASGSSGTAFFVSNKGYLLTNNHVVEGCALSKITYQNKDYDTKLIATDKTLDLALLKAEIKPKSFFNFSKDDVKKLNKVYVAGYPLGKGLSDDLKISSGIVSSLKGFEDNSNEIQIDAPINPGNSGGPIINENGDLIAIAVSGLAKDQTEGINFGIKSSAAETFLRSNKINPKKSMYAGIKDNDKLLEILEEGTVYTYCD